MSGDQSMEAVYLAMADASDEEKLAQINAHLAQLAAQGYDRIEGPILQMAKATTRPGKRPDLLAVLRQFEQYVTTEAGTLFYGHFPDADDPNVVHSVQVFEDWDALCAHMRNLSYSQFVAPIMRLAAPGSPHYSFGSCLFMHRGKGTGPA